MREPDYQNDDLADFRHVTVVPGRKGREFVINGLLTSRRTAIEILDDLAAAIAWYERRQADSEEGR